jgi:hypothetical protein
VTGKEVARSALLTAVILFPFLLATAEYPDGGCNTEVIVSFTGIDKLPGRW